MLPLVKILCPTDFEDAAQAALAAAAELAGLFWAELTLLHIVEPLRAVVCVAEGAGFVMAPHAAAAATDGLISAASDRLRRLAERLPGGLSHRERVAFGTPVGRIVEIAREEKVDLIVMGTRRRTWLERWFAPSTTEAVTRAVDCPVLVVHNPC